MICPVFSIGRDTTMVTSGTSARYTNYCDCLKEECAWWIKDMVRVGEEPCTGPSGERVSEEDQGRCAIKFLAEKIK